MDEYHQHDNSEHGFTRVHEFAERSDAPGADGEEPGKDRDQGRVGTFEVNAEALGRKIQALAAR
jgi:hypothetical protein